MPGLEPLLKTADPELVAEHPEDVQLWLASALPSTSRASQCVGGLPQLEYLLRSTHALKSLQDIRRLRRLAQPVREKMQSHIGNTQKTRNRSLLDKVNAQSRHAVATYPRKRPSRTWTQMRGLRNGRAPCGSSWTSTFMGPEIRNLRIWEHIRIFK